MKFTHLTALFAATMVSFLMTACGGEPSVEGTDQGVQITKQTEMDLRVVAANGEAKVTIEVHRNGPRDVAFIRDPAIDSPYDSDLTIRNRHGFPFVMSGNHGLPTDSGTGPQAVFKQHDQLEDLRLAIETAEQLRNQPGVRERYIWELRSLYYMADKALKGANDMIDGNSASGDASQAPSNRLVTIADGNVATAHQALTLTYSHRVGVLYDPVYGYAGHHSAIYLEVYNSLGAFVGAVSTRNHGREAIDPTMTMVGSGCPKTFSGRANPYPNMQPFIATDTFGTGDAGGCNTAYDELPATPYQHNCNDDSLAEYLNVKNNSGAVWPTCSDTSFRYYAPGCT